jgi:3-hydroxyacyl-[acyl-carrier-protein] dehydratase
MNAAPMNTAPMFAELRIATDHPAFSGHFPGLPILPGAALLDEAVHEIARSRQLDLRGWRVATVKFLAPVRPGALLTLEHAASGTAAIRFALYATGIVVASGMLTGPAAAGNTDGV